MIESVQYNTAFAITGEIKGISQQKTYYELALDLCVLENGSDDCDFYKIKITLLPSYLYELVPKSNHNYNTRNFDHIDPYHCRIDIFNYSFSRYKIVEWNKIDTNFKNTNFHMCLRNSLLKISRPVQNSFLTFLIHQEIDF